jgi:hypothetical protein
LGSSRSMYLLEGVRGVVSLCVTVGNAGIAEIVVCHWKIMYKLLKSSFFATLVSK